jgi:predicted Zn-dependent protease with MMP-like domain
MTKNIIAIERCRISLSASTPKNQIYQLRVCVFRGPFGASAQPTVLSIRRRAFQAFWAEQSTQLIDSVVDGGIRRVSHVVDKSSSSVLD